MPRKYLMSWNAHLGAWQKMHKGQRYQVYCSELGVPATEIDSYQAANEWWREKLETISAGPLHPHYESAIKNLALVAGINELGSGGSKLVQPATQLSARQLEAEGRKKNPKPLPREVTNLNLHLLREFRESPQLLAMARDRLGIVTSTSPVVVDKTIGPHLDTFLSTERIRQKPQTYREVANYFKTLTAEKFFARSKPLAEIDEKTVDAHYDYLGSREIAAAGKKKYLGFFRRFVAYLGERRLVVVPYNLKSKSHRFKPTRKKIKTYDGVVETISELPGEFQLWALLGLNCSMTQADLGELSWSQIDIRKGTLTRSRVKTEQVKDAPEVTYKLWPETLRLLKARPNRKGLVFSTAEGTKLYVAKYEETESGPKETKKDMFSTYWGRWDFVARRNKSKKQKTNPNPIPISLGKFRNVGSTALKADARYRGFVDVFLANVPNSIADKHYAAEHNEPFFAATDFIRTHLQIERLKINEG